MSFNGLLVALLFVIAVSCFASDNASLGFLEGHLTILPFREVELADSAPSKLSAQNYAEYPLIILSRDGKKGVARVTADENGNYRLALPAGAYILDLYRGRPKGHIRAKPQHFTVTSNQTVRVNMNIDTGVR